MKRIRRSLLTVLALVFAIVAMPAPPTARAQQPSQVGLVVQFGDGRVTTRCIEFGESEISGYDVLARSGLDFVTNFDSGIGAAICAINGEGCPASDCFCQCKGSPCRYWIYHHLIDGQWVYSNLGATGYRVHHGDVEGWIWGEGTPQGGAQPPAISFDQICVSQLIDTPMPPTETPTTPPPTETMLPVAEAWFRLDANPISSGTCTYVRWDAANADYAYLDGEAVAPNGSREICPDTPLNLSLRVGNTHNERTYTLTLGTLVAADASPTSPPPTATPQATPMTSLTATPRASLTPSETPTAARTPTTTATRRPTETPTATSTMTPSATAPAVATDTPYPTTPPSPEPAGSPVPETPSGSSGYVVFGVIAGGLLIGLIWHTRRRK